MEFKITTLDSPGFSEILECVFYKDAGLGRAEVEVTVKHLFPGTAPVRRRSVMRRARKDMTFVFSGKRYDIQGEAHEQRS